MKKLKYLILSLLFVGLASCEGEDEVIADFGANAVLVDDEITVLDQDEALTIDLFTRNVAFESVEIQDDGGSVLAEATLGDGTATFNASAFGDLSAGEVVDFWIVSTLSNGEVIRQPASLSVTTAASLDAPSTLVYMDPSEALLEYGVSTFAAGVDSFVLEWSLDGETWMDTEFELDPAGGSIDLSTLDLDALGVEPGDTIEFRVVAESGAFTDVATADVEVVTQDFGSSASGSLSSDDAMGEFSFTDGVVLEEGSGAGEIGFMEPSGFAVINDAPLGFVPVTVPSGMTAAEWIDSLDLFDAEVLFEDGTPVTSVEQVSNGDVFVYKITRDGDDYYGILTVGTVTETTVDGEESIEFEFQFQEGTIVRE